MSLGLSISSALNLTLSGSIGTFSVGTGKADQKTVDVKYFLTHVGLNFASSANEEVLKHLAPVREIFPTTELEFDEIMQRDIDDARVSSELVPYLLDHRSKDLVKLFPPIIVVVMPVKELDNRPADYYPKVETETRQMSDHDLEILRSGPIGQELFEFQQPRQGNVLFEHDLVKLRLNTNKSKLVIVDGQHRAMALLAIYRNLKQDWSDAMRAPYKDYYEEWTPSYIQQFSLKNISLPVMFCTFPALDETYGGGYNVKMAARSIFLTLNKTARQVSASRNRLLDDNDLIALFLRDTLSTIKRKDARSSASLRISNVELDQAHDRVKIDSPIAMTSVNHIYYFIEHILLNKRDEDVNGAKPRSGKFYKRTELQSAGALERLDGRNVLGADVADATSRNFYTPDAGGKLTAQFHERFGRHIVAAFERFLPFEAHAGAVLWLEQQLLSQSNTKLRPILFEGQGIGRTFAAHQENLAEKLGAGEFGSEATKIQEVADRLKATQKLVQDFIQKLRHQRAERVLASVADKRALRLEDGSYQPKVLEFINDLYDNVLTTVAFQSALVAGFFGEIERCNLSRTKDNAAPLDVTAEFDRYISELNAFFSPSKASDVRRLIEVFVGTPEGEIRDWKVGPSASTFRRVVYRGEMQPDQWPKYKYLLLEIWRAEGSELADSLRQERVKCRNQIFNSLLDEYRKDFLERKLMREENLTPQDRAEIADSAYESFRNFLKNVGWRYQDVPAKAALLKPPKAEDATEAPPADETWESVEPD
ncbi:DNA sulfur modification protein DndB [Acuticoccus sp. I52.16.1]|uniref:DNA sulfur modification protein DndB n=1 Tax=Acuticoccus sp. I52.16.1 TaxID=2928472 RepID=UPI001FD5E04E|nr:DNA sulfur modification protein DndB [Acuticoccus sp. I52.16.1]UOM36712.1 hypothetical protein MRB58_11200 [Acuticoccus sp. I52.16.1]